MNARQIEAFRMVMITGTVTAAAERMCISQPAVSRLLTLLEDRTGLTLFIRAKQRLQPTPEAQQFFREVERSYIGLDKLEKSALNIRNAMTGTLRIASVPIAGMAFLPRVIARYRRAHPDVTISLQTRSSTTVVDWVSSTNYDIGFAAGAPDQPNLQTITFADVKGVCVLPPSHRLVAREFVEASDLDGEEFISLDPMDGNRAAVDRLCENANIRRRLTLEAPYAAVVAAMVALGLGVSVLSPLAILDLGPDKVCAKPFVPEIRFKFSLVYRKDLVLSLAARSFLETAREQFVRLFGPDGLRFPG
jgi:DNA-binding transcriptional LysR family regulator